MGKKEELPAQPKQRREGSGVWEKGEGGLPFIEPSSGYVRLHHQMAGDGRARLQGLVEFQNLHIFKREVSSKYMIYVLM